jgi:hypothetical protein
MKEHAEPQAPPDAVAVEALVLKSKQRLMMDRMGNNKTYE